MTHDQNPAVGQPERRQYEERKRPSVAGDGVGSGVGLEAQLARLGDDPRIAAPAPAATRARGHTLAVLLEKGLIPSPGRGPRRTCVVRRRGTPRCNASSGGAHRRRPCRALDLQPRRPTDPRQRGTRRPSGTCHLRPDWAITANHHPESVQRWSDNHAPQPPPPRAVVAATPATRVVPDRRRGMGDLSRVRAPRAD